MSLIALGLSAIPSLINLFTSDNKTDAVIDLANKAGELLGVEDKSPESIVKHLESNPDAVIKLKELEVEAQKLENEHLRAMLSEANRHEEHKEDTRHETYRVNSTQSDKIADQVIKMNLPIIALLTIINISLVYFLQDKATLIAIASNIIGVVIGKLLGERQSIINFFFGSSVGSKEKDEKLHHIAQGRRNANG